MPRSSQRRRQLAILSLTAMIAVQIADAAGPFTNGQPASAVLGQPDFASSAATPVTGASLNFPVAVAPDASGNVWVADHFNARVLLYTAPFTNGKAASVVIGQPDLTSNAQNSDGRTARSLGTPNAVAVDAAGNLWVADGGANGRVLRYSPPFTNFMSASLVLGTPNFTSATPGTTNATFGSASTGGGPTGLAFDPSGNLWVLDEQNNRALRFDAPFTNGKAASVVLGQVDFVSRAAPTPPTASSLNLPSSVAVDSAGNVWIADTGNHRVLKYTAPVSNGQAASTVIGQTLFTATNVTAPTASSLQAPMGVSVDPGGQLWIVDQNRLLGYNPPFANGQAAAIVLGQPDFTSNAAPAPPTASSLKGPLGSPAFIGPQLWVADRANNRVLVYAPPGLPPPPPRPTGGDIVSPGDFPYKVTFEQRCVESFARLCLRTEIVRVCVGGNCFDPRPNPNPPCVRCYVGYAAAAGAAVGAVGALLLRRRRKP